MSGLTKAHEKDQKILDAATKFFLIHGFSGTTTDMIQKEAGVSKATMYGEFKHEVRQFEKSYDNQQAEQISLMV